MQRILAAKRLFAVGLLAMMAGLFCLALTSASPAYAITIVPACARQTNCSGGSCPPPTLSCAIATFRNVASLIVGITGGAALLMFVYGGFMLLTSGGVESRVTSGKTILKNAIIGIVLVFTAGYIIDYAVQRLTTGGRWVTEGTACNNGFGQYRIISGRGPVCQTPCSARPNVEAGYQCTSEPDASACNTDFTGCSGGARCCIPPPPPPVNAPPEENLPPIEL